MTTTITIDPITRIEGHLRADVTLDEGVVTEARVSGTMARGIESLLAGKDPRDAAYVTERICGVCFSAHGWTSSLAVETAHGTAQLPEAARLLRNLIVGAAWLHDHPLHFYHLSALDYLDLRVLTDYEGSDSYIRKLRDLVLGEISGAGTPGASAGPLMPTYSPDDFCIADLDTVVSAVSHYLDALQMQAKAKKLSALFGGKQPHQSGIIPGGVTALPSSSTRALFGEMLAEQASFIRDVYVQDVLTLGTGPLLALATSDVGVGHQNYLSFGGFPQGDGSFLYPQGALVDGALVATSRDEIEPVLSEDISGAWYASPSAGHPSASEQSFDLAKPDAYSFVKAPRFQGHPMEVGPLARMMVALQRPEHPTNSHEAVRTFADLVDQGVQPGAVARHAARALETIILCDAMKAWLDELEALAGSSNTVEIHDTQHWDPPSTGIGFGLTEAPRGSLGHWVEIAGKKISHYACVVPTTWNASPTDQQGIRGPFEQALLGCPVPDANNPINVGRVLRSFDPCMACAVHLITPSRDATRFAIESGLREK